MAFAARKLPDESALVVTIDVPIERYVSNLRSLNAEIGHQVQKIAAVPCYLILDLHDLDLACSDFLLWIEEYRSGPDHFLNHPTLSLLIIGVQPMLIVGIKKIEQQLQVPITRFDTLADSLAFVQKAAVVSA